ncbi:MAG: 30S ribosomal protein S8 [Chloroflexi bacterium]|nr:30S ribosomal protein S8 [Chloroflexota bacterium]MCL5946683.1 30S ribosomal protein S8 [Chloroflexota bacterium]
MNVTDSIADMLTRIRNASMARHLHVTVPASQLKKAIAQVLMDEGWIADYEYLDEGPQGEIRITLKYTLDKKPVIVGLKRVSRPGLRIYTKRGQIPRVMGGLGTAVLSTSRGVMTGKQAYYHHIGGEVLCYIW